MSPRSVNYAKPAMASIAMRGAEDVTVPKIVANATSAASRPVPSRTAVALPVPAELPHGEFVQPIRLTVAARIDVAQHLHVLAERQPFLEHPLPFGERGIDVEDEIAAGLGGVVVEVDRQPKPHHVNSVGRASARTCSSRSLSGAGRRRSIRANEVPRSLR